VAAGHTDGFVRAFDPTGGPRRALQFGTRKIDYAYWAVVDGESLLVVGSTAGRFPGQTNAGEGDGLLARIALA